MRSRVAKSSVVRRVTSRWSAGRSADACGFGPEAFGVVAEHDEPLGDGEVANTQGLCVRPQEMGLWTVPLSLRYGRIVWSQLPWLGMDSADSAVALVPKREVCLCSRATPTNKPQLPS